MAYVAFLSARYPDKVGTLTQPLPKGEEKDRSPFCNEPSLTVGLVPPIDPPR